MFLIQDADGNEGFYELTGELSHGVPMVRLVETVVPLVDIAADLLAQDLDAELARLETGEEH